MVIGSYVEVKDHMRIYSNYTKMFKQLHFRDTISVRSCRNGEKGHIFAIGYHLESKTDLLYGIELGNGKQILIHSKGVKLIKKKIHETW